jgi:hypothetical protein
MSTATRASWHGAIVALIDDTHNSVCVALKGFCRKFSFVALCGIISLHPLWSEQRESTMGIGWNVDKDDKVLSDALSSV